MQELQANIKNVDVVHTSDAGHFVLLKEKKLLAKYTPRRGGVSRRLQGQGRLLLRPARHLNAITYNTKAMSAAEAPKTWKDLLDPKWKGKLVTAHPATAASSPSTCWPSSTCTAGTTSRRSRRTA